jgi:hypothetical protein
MNIWIVPWYTTILVEANKFWFYGICVSIIGTAGELLFGSSTQKKAPKEDKSNSDEKKAESENLIASEPVSWTTSPWLRIIVDSLDLTLPTSFLGWTSLGNLEVGSAMALSTVLAWGDAWAKAQK